MKKQASSEEGKGCFLSGPLTKKLCNLSFKIITGASIPELSDDFLEEEQEDLPNNAGMNLNR